MRLDKLLGNMGYGSRKELRTLVKKGFVTVDGVVPKSSDINVDPEKQVILFNGDRVTYKPYVYLMMNKPQGVISATEDSRGQRCAVDLVGEEFSMYDLSPAGRLDIDTEGFLLLTNDGGFIHDVISPKKHVVKEYYACLEGVATEEDVKAFADGLVLADGTECMEAELVIVGTDLEANTSEVLVRICEGKFHQVKRMALSRGLKVTYLKRMAIGGLRLGTDLEVGEYRELTLDEKESILR